MPPRASNRRPNQSPSKDPEAPISQPRGLVRPYLPPLTGTPSSRRQYTYGSGVEPPPRVGRGPRRMNLKDAVGQALAAKDDEDLVPRRSHPHATVEDDSGPDGLAQSSARRFNAPSLNPPSNQTAGQASNLSSRFSAIDEDDDSARSFSMESDFFVDASIASATSNQVHGSRPTRSMAQGRALPDVHAKDVPVSSPVKAPQTRSASLAQTWLGGDAEARQVGRTQQPQQLVQEDTDEEGVDEVDAADAARGHQDFGNTPAPNRMRRANLQQQQRTEKESAFQRTHEDEEQDQEESPEREERVGLTSASIARALKAPTLKPPSSVEPVPAPTKHRQSKQPRVEPSRSVEEPIVLRRTLRSSQGQDQGLGQLQTQTSEREEIPRNQQQKSNPLRQDRSLGLGRTIPQHRRDPSSQNQGLSRHSREPDKDEDSFNNLDYSGDRREHDEQIWREMQEAEKQADLRKEEQRREQLAEQQEARRRQWAWFMALWPMSLFQRLTQHRENARDLEDNENGPVEWIRLLYPTTYFQTLVWLFDKLMDKFVNFIDRLASLQVRRRFVQHGHSLLWILVSLVVGIASVALAVMFGPAIANGLVPSSGLSIGRVNWPSLGHITDKIGGFVPSISWSSDQLDDISDLWESDDNDDGENTVKQILNRFEKGVASLKRTSQLHNASLKKLEILMPKIVRMELKNGKPVITQEFWHALRDLISKDDQFLNVKKTRDGYEFTSEEQWRAIVKRLSEDPVYAKKLNSSVTKLEERVWEKMTGAWHNWIQKNDKRFSELLGKSDDWRKASDKRLAQMIKEELQHRDIQEVVVTREEFLRHLQNELAGHRSEIRGELSRLESQIEPLREAIRLAKENARLGGSKQELVSLVQSLVDKTIADMNLGSIASSKIQRHWQAELKNHVNYFSIGAGATIDAQRTSLVYDPHRKGSLSPDKFSKGILGIKPLPPIAALKPWNDEGECFCAVRSENYRGNPHGATLSVQLGHNIIPQNIVIEHILPGATTDPDARPKNIEVWAYIDDPTVRSRVEDFSITQFPDDKSDWNFQRPDYGTAFVKIGQFVYQNAELHDGVHVHRLNSELQNLGAVTDQVIIRAVSNYGAVNHTCFYRVRLYGQRV
ncbi:hypothetical protein BGZ63DRAFT_421905 [Mariannaea sp. PMI_226]|nr:hypothetical protein BGZ63DRAFT_421905 [Mariannaea sp. PMI_226]